MQILLADTDKLFADDIQESLKNNNVMVFQASNTDEAIDSLRRISIDLVVVDLNPDRFDCSAIYQKAKDLDSYCMVFYSMESSDFPLLCSVPKYNPDDVIIKPCKPLELYLKAQLVYRYKFNSLLVSDNLLPLCAHCKKVRDDDGHDPGKGPWKPVDRYLNEKYGVLITHSICPDCVQQFS